MDCDTPPLKDLKCPNCKNRLETSVEIRDHPLCDRVYIHKYKCPKCDYIFKRRRKTPTLEFSIKKMLARVSGDIGENIAFKVLVKKGFDIVSFGDLVSELGDDYETFIYDQFSEEYLKKFFDEKHLQNFIRFCRAWAEDPDIPSGKIRKHYSASNNERYVMFRSAHFGPDWVGKKNGKFYLIDVKTNRAALQKYQKKMLLKAKGFGFVPLIIRVKVDVRAPLEELRIEEL